MRIAIVTLQLHTNCGGVLQAFALQSILKSLGHSSEIIQLYDTIPEPHGLRRCWKICTRSLRKVLSGSKNLELEREKRINREFPIVGREYLDFFDKFLAIRRISSYDEIKESDYDAFLVGSDQVWRPKYNPVLLHSYLDFTGGWKVRRVAYSVSFGTSEWEYPYSLTRRTAQLAKSFDVLSFRETSGCENCKLYFDLDSELMPDPTLLLTVDEYLSIVGTSHDTICHSKKQVFEYILDRSDESLLKVKSILDSHFPNEGYEENCFLTSDPRAKGPVNERIQRSPLQWIEGISNSDIIITDSFHACVFALIFHRNFIVLRNDSRGFSRISTLLDEFGMSETMGAGPETDWDKVESKIKELRQKGQSFLKEQLILK